MNRSPNILNRLPEFWQKADGSVIKAIVDSISTEMGLVDTQMGNVDAVLGIDTVSDADLYARWGSLLNIKLRNGEPSTVYRGRLKTAIPNLAGGTATAIRNTVLVGLSLEADLVNIGDRIQVMDAWEYTGSEGGNIDKSPGNVVVLFDSTIADTLDTDIISRIQTAVNTAKAAGVNVYIIWYKTDVDLATLYGTADDELTINIKSSTTVGVDDNATINLEEFVATTISDAVSSLVADVCSVVNYSQEESITNSPLYVTNSTFISNTKSGYDIVKQNGVTIQVV